MTTISLPPVAKSFYTFCKKCETDRYHTVLAHPTSTTAKIKCEVCGKTGTWKAPSTAAAKKRKAGEAAARSPRARSSHREQWESLLQTNAAAEENDYNLKKKFEVNTLLKHPKFGRGFIRAAQSDKIEVVFEDEVKMLMHNRN
jgi:hypothetical protein